MSIERDLLRTAVKIIEDNMSTTSLSNFIYEVDELLAQPEKEQEPVAWMYERQKGDFTERTLSVGFEKNFDGTTIPLYTSPPLIRKPLSGREISHGFRSDQDATNAESYWAGVAYAEKCHGIGEQE